jgi:DNA-binding SARP family transcriptional activator
MSGDIGALRIRLLGSLEVVCNGRQVDLGGSKNQLVMASLLFNANRLVGVDWMELAVWERPPQSIRSNLRTYVSRLRGAMDVVGISPDRLAAEIGGYRFLIEDGELDLWDFDDLMKAGEKAFSKGAYYTAVENFEHALALWRGQPLAGLRPGPLLEAEVQWLRERWMLLWQQWADASLAIGRHERVAIELAGLVRVDPLREKLWMQLMLALYRCGRRVEALNAFRDLTGLLQDELGIEPDWRLKNLRQRMLAADPVLDPV